MNQKTVRPKPSSQRKNKKRHGGGPLRADTTRFMRDLAAHRGKEMSDSCRQACTAIITPSAGKLDQAYVDATHLSDVQTVQIVRCVSRGTFDSQSGDGRAWLAVDARAIGTDVTCGMSSTASSVSTGFPANNAAAPTGAKVHRFLNTEWTQANQISSLQEVKTAYVASELRVWNTSQPLYANGISCCLSVPISEFEFNPNFDNTLARPLAEVHAGTQEVRTLHFADVIAPTHWNAVADGDSPNNLGLYTSATVGIAPGAYTHFFYNKGMPSVGQTWYFELTTYVYAYGPAVAASAPLVRVPGLWTCLRDTFAEKMPGHTVAAPAGDLDRRAQSYTSRFVDWAAKLMQSRAAEQLGLALVGTAKALIV